MTSRDQTLFWTLVFLSRDTFFKFLNEYKSSFNVVYCTHIDSSRGINAKQHSIQCFSKQKFHSRPAVSREISASQNIASRVFRYKIRPRVMLCGSRMYADCQPDIIINNRCRVMVLFGASVHKAHPGYTR